MAVRAQDVAPTNTQTPAPAPTFLERAQTMASDALASTLGMDWNALLNDLTSVGLAEAKKALDGVDLTAAKATYDELAALLGRQDFTQAAKYADKLDELLSSDLAVRVVGLLKLESEKGSAAAIAAVNEYLNTPGLGENSRLFGEAMLSHFQSAERKDVEGALFLATFYIVRSQIPVIDGHQRDALAMLVAQAIPLGFHAYDLHTKEGMEVSDAIFTAMGIERKDAAKAWKAVMDGGLKGFSEFKKSLTGQVPTPPPAIASDPAPPPAPSVPAEEKATRSE